MTDRAYRAKNWLMRADVLEDERKRALNRLLLLESKVNSCVVNYDCIGSRDPMTARAAHEDLIIEYSKTRAELENITDRVIHEDLITLRAIDRLNNTKLQSLLVARYIARKSVKTLINEKVFEYEKTQIYKLEYKALDIFGAILETKPEIIPAEKLENSKDNEPIQAPA